MPLVARSSAIDITVCPVETEEMDEYLRIIFSLFESDKADNIVGYIRNGFFYELGETTGTTSHYTLEFVKWYQKSSWIVMLEHPSRITNTMSLITNRYSYIAEAYDLWADERKNSLIAVVTNLGES
jgi:hypothetical protein